jgi:hypothetical protein
VKEKCRKRRQGIVGAPSTMNSFATAYDKIAERRNAQSLHYGIIFNLALGHTGHGIRYVREPDFWDHPRRQERRCHPCSRISVGTCIWVDLFLCGKTAAKMIFQFMAHFGRTDCLPLCPLSGAKLPRRSVTDEAVVDPTQTLKSLLHCLRISVLMLH